MVNKFKTWLWVALFTLVTLPAFAETSPLVGKWLTMDDKTNQPRSIVQIREEQGQFSGKLIKIYYRAGEAATDICKQCAGTNKDQLFIGMKILWNMQLTADNEWGGGFVQDPVNGKIYHCLIKVDPDQQKLQIRGYIGVPLLGRTQTWVRVSGGT